MCARHRRRRRGDSQQGGGALCPPKICRCKNSGKTGGKFEPFFWGGGSSIIFAGITCRISCTPNPILKFRRRTKNVCAPQNELVPYAYVCGLPVCTCLYVCFVYDFCQNGTRTGQWQIHESGGVTNPSKV